MYQPKWHRDDRKELLSDLMSHNPLVTLVSASQAAGGGLPEINHYPALLEWDEAGEHAHLIFHVSKANPQYKILLSDLYVHTVLLHGPHAYISAGWYEAHPENAPTWNYLVAHGHGKPELITDAAEQKMRMADMVMAFEADRDEPWDFATMPEKAWESMRNGIGIFRLPIQEWSIKLKNSQNRSPKDRRQVREKLYKRGNPDDTQLADMMTDLENLNAPQLRKSESEG